MHLLTKCILTGKWWLWSPTRVVLAPFLVSLARLAVLSTRLLSLFVIVVIIIYFQLVILIHRIIFF